jgi:hypothetical protein
MWPNPATGIKFFTSATAVLPFVADKVSVVPVRVVKTVRTTNSPPVQVIVTGVMVGAVALSTAFSA